MQIFLYKKNWIVNCEKNYKQTCGKQKIANVSSVNECHKIDTSSRARKTEHMRSRQSVLFRVRYTNNKLSPSSNAIRHFLVVVLQWWQRIVDRTIKCTCKVVDLLIKLSNWPNYASRIRRRSWRAVVSTTLSIKLYFTCLELQCIFYPFSVTLEILEGIFSIISLTQPNTQNTVDRKENKG